MKPEQLLYELRRAEPDRVPRVLATAIAGVGHEHVLEVLRGGRRQAEKDLARCRRLLHARATPTDGPERTKQIKREHELAKARHTLELHKLSEAIRLVNAEEWSAR